MILGGKPTLVDRQFVHRLYGGSISYATASHRAARLGLAATSEEVEDETVWPTRFVAADSSCAACSHARKRMHGSTVGEADPSVVVAGCVTCLQLQWGRLHRDE